MATAAALAHANILGQTQADMQSPFLMQGDFPLAATPPYPFVAESDDLHLSLLDGDLLMTPRSAAFEQDKHIHEATQVAATAATAVIPVELPSASVDLSTLPQANLAPGQALKLPSSSDPEGESPHWEAFRKAMKMAQMALLQQLLSYAEVCACRDPSSSGLCRGAATS